MDDYRERKREKEIERQKARRRKKTSKDFETFYHYEDRLALNAPKRQRDMH